VHSFVEAADGQKIAARFYHPEREPKGSVLIVPAMGCSQEYYGPHNTESIHGFYSGAPRTMKRIVPQDIGARRIGHFGFLRSAYEASL